MPLQTLVTDAEHDLTSCQGRSTVVWARRRRTRSGNSPGAMELARVSSSPCPADLDVVSEFPGCESPSWAAPTGGRCIDFPREAPINRGTETSPSRHRLGPRDMPFKLKRFRHVAVAIPEVRVTCRVAASPRR
jgi:hypothetical protein